MPRKTTKVKISISIDLNLLKWVDKQVESNRFRNRSHGIEYALFWLQRVIYEYERARPPPSRGCEKKIDCRSCLRWVDEKCTEVSLDTSAVFPNCFLSRELGERRG